MMKGVVCQSDEKISEENIKEEDKRHMEGMVRQIDREVI
jgi:hypothetical protein